MRVRLPAVQTETDQGAVLFFSTGNCCRSQMAEGFAREMVTNGKRVYSASTSPHTIHPLAIRVMREVGVDISSQHSKGLEEIPLDRINQVVTLCEEIDDQCPALGRQVERIHWPLPDPALAVGDEQQVLTAFRRVRDEIQSRIQELFSPSALSRENNRAVG